MMQLAQQNPKEKEKSNQTEEKIHKESKNVVMNKENI
jgi:hypothetical protein